MKEFKTVEVTLLNELEMLYEKADYILEKGIASLDRKEFLKTNDVVKFAFDTKYTLEKVMKHGLGNKL